MLKKWSKNPSPKLQPLQCHCSHMIKIWAFSSLLWCCNSIHPIISLLCPFGHPTQQHLFDDSIRIGIELGAGGSLRQPVATTLRSLFQLQHHCCHSDMQSQAPHHGQSCQHNCTKPNCPCHSILHRLYFTLLMFSTSCYTTNHTSLPFSKLCVPFSQSFWSSPDIMRMGSCYSPNNILLYDHIAQR